MKLRCGGLAFVGHGGFWDTVTGSVSENVDKLRVLSELRFWGSTCPTARSCSAIAFCSQKGEKLKALAACVQKDSWGRVKPPSYALWPKPKAFCFMRSRRSCRETPWRQPSPARGQAGSITLQRTVTFVWFAYIYIYI